MNQADAYRLTPPVALLTCKCTRCGADSRAIITSPDTKVHCLNCGAGLASVQQFSGFVYVLSNPRMLGLYKVGSTQRPIKDRIAELSASSGVPAPFVLEALFPSPTPPIHERRIHDALASRRLPDREFFEMPLPAILAECARVCQIVALYPEDTLPVVGRPLVAKVDGNRYFCPRCGKRMRTQLRNSLGWACRSCRIRVDKAGITF
jgi:DNA-directed RNA polymerase subunit RPC12/RpoP